jgi:hypothetical protein
MTAQVEMSRTKGNQDSVMSLVEMSETKCQVKPGRVPHAINSTHKSEITEGTNPLLLYLKEVQKRESRTIKIVAVECSKPLK